MFTDDSKQEITIEDFYVVYLKFKLNESVIMFVPIH